MTTRARRQSPPESEFFGVLGGIVVDQAHVVGLPDDIARSLASGIEGEVRSALGGGYWYIHAPSKADRNHAIQAGFRNGQRLNALAVEYGLSEARIRQILEQTP
jgi:Mor family transcriptional regulator